jgi:CDP-glycerol glycerophosphotransferase
MGKYAGKIVENSQDGILNGMHDFVSGKVKCENTDFEAYNRVAIEEFINLINY